MSSTQDERAAARMREVDPPQVVAGPRRERIARGAARLLFRLSSNAYDRRIF